MPSPTPTGRKPSPGSGTGGVTATPASTPAPTPAPTPSPTPATGSPQPPAGYQWIPQGIARLKQGASMGMQLTGRMRQYLLDRGMQGTDIDKLTPQEAWQKIEELWDKDTVNNPNASP